MLDFDNSSATKPNFSKVLDLEFLLPLDLVMRFSFSANSNSPKTTFKVIVLPFLKITKGTDLPTGVPATTLGNSFIVSILMPLNFKITSPVFTPAF